MSPAVRDYSAGIGVDRTEQCAQRIVKADNENRRAERLQILRHKTHPKLFACANDKNGDEQDDEIAFEPEESSEGFQRRHVRVLSDSLALFKSTRAKSCGGFSLGPAHRLWPARFLCNSRPIKKQANPGADSTFSETTMDEEKSELVAKVPQVTFLFWVVKVLATTLGETAGDAVTMSWLGETTSEAKGTGYLIGTGIFGVIFIVAVLVQIRAKKFHPFLYWLTIVATTTVGTTLADYCTRSLGIGYTGGSTILLICVIASLLIWRWSTGSISIETVSTPKVEIFYWVTIMFSQTLGTALGDWVADTNEIGYLGAAAVFGGLLLLTALLYYLTSFSRVILFWAAFILTRPLGATLGDFLDKPIAQGGLALSRYTASLALLVVIVALILIFPQKPASKAH